MPVEISSSRQLSSVSQMVTNFIALRHPLLLILICYFYFILFIFFFKRAPVCKSEEVFKVHFIIITKVLQLDCYKILRTIPLSIEIKGTHEKITSYFASSAQHEASHCSHILPSEDHQ